VEIDDLRKILPENDLNYLISKHDNFEVIQNGGEIHLIFHNYDFPNTYTPSQADLLVILPTGYPNASLDMFWTYPDVKLTNGAWPQAAEAHANYHGKDWQRWSRHISWRSNIDNLRTFLIAVRKEIEKGR
jgi:hypothetical protein